MNPLLVEWIAKAEGDFAVMQREARVRKDPNYDAVCFHAQQCAEKYLKARLYAGGIRFAKIHNLVLLLDQTLAVEPSWNSFRADLSNLTVSAVGFRYPGDAADQKMARQSVLACRKFRLAARTALGLGSRKHT
jgi:HEPN domain-containing protein